MVVRPETTCNIDFLEYVCHFNKISTNVHKCSLPVFGSIFTAELIAINPASDRIKEINYEK